MKYLVLPVLLLAALASGQWSEPAPVPYDSACANYQFIMTRGDTLLALWTGSRVGRDSAVAYASWAIGDSWSEPESIDVTECAWCAAAGVDGEGRVWFLRFDGTIPWGRDLTSCVVASVREGASWRNLHHVLGMWDPWMAGVAGLDFAIDRFGQPWLGINEHVHEGGSQYSSARFARLQGDTCTWPGYVVRGETLPHYRTAGVPLLGPRPDSGMWSACQVSIDSTDRFGVHIFHVRNDTAVLLHEFGRILCDAAVDSAGRLWVVYFDSLTQLWSATVNVDSTVEHRLIAERVGGTDAVSVAVDSDGWVWCAWPAEDSTLAVAWNRGGEWSEPERAVSTWAYVTRLVSDSRGQMRLFYSRSSQWRSVRRLTRPGIEESPRPQASSTRPAPTILSGASGTKRLASSVVYDASGRRVASPKSGVFFVRAASGELSAVGCQRVILQK